MIIIPQNGNDIHPNLMFQTKIKSRNCLILLQIWQLTGIKVYFAVVELINNRPRKRLGFRTPAEVLKNSFLNSVALGLTINFENGSYLLTTQKKI